MPSFGTFPRRMAGRCNVRKLIAKQKLESTSSNDRLGSDSDFICFGKSRLLLEHQRTVFVHYPFMSP